MERHRAVKLQRRRFPVKRMQIRGLTQCNPCQATKNGTGKLVYNHRNKEMIDRMAVPPSRPLCMCSKQNERIERLAVPSCQKHALKALGGSHHHEKARAALLVSRFNLTPEITKEMCRKGIEKRFQCNVIATGGVCAYLAGKYCVRHVFRKPLANNRLSARKFEKRILVQH